MFPEVCSSLPATTIIHTADAAAPIPLAFTSNQGFSCLAHHQFAKHKQQVILPAARQLAGHLHHLPDLPIHQLAQQGKVFYGTLQGYIQ